MSSVAILGQGLVTPGVNSVNALASVTPLSGEPPRETASIPPPEGMTVRDQRRQARLTRLALYAADHAAAQAGVRGRDAGIYMGLTHGTASFLKEFHDYLFDYGPEMASPNAFSSGVTNAPLGAISLHQKLSQGGATMVGIETCGLDALNHAAAKVLDGTHDLCYAGACEEYAPVVEQVYRRIGWYGGELPGALPWPYAEKSAAGFGLSEGAVVCVIAPCVPAPATAGWCRYTPLDFEHAHTMHADLVISCAGGGPADQGELDALLQLLPHYGRRMPLIFSKHLFGETFAVGPLLSLALARDILLRRSAFAPYALHPSLSGLATADYRPESVGSVLVLAASRNGSIAAGLLELPAAVAA